MSRLLIVVALCFSAVVSAAPQIPALSGRVVDTAGLLSTDSVAQLTQKLAAHETATSNQLVVLTVPDLQGYDVADFALAVARNWQLGQKELNNGALLLVARDERKIRIEVGYGLEGDLTDALSKRIIQNEIRPAFKKGNFNLGISSGVDAMLGTIEGTYSPPERQGGGGIMDTPLIPLGFIGLFGLANFLQGRVKTQFINALVGGGFGGVIVAIASQKWYLGVLAGLAFAFFVSRARTGGPHRSIGAHPDDRYRSGGFRSGGGFGGGGGGFGGGGGGFGGGGGGFGGGGGGFGGGGASGGW